jgi:hypothetical protein
MRKARIDSEESSCARQISTGDAMVTALKTLGPQFVARGFASNFVEQLSNATTVLRNAIDQRSAQVGRRTGTTAAIARDGRRAIQLVRVIDTLVRPVIESNEELLATWNNIVALPRSPRSGGVVVVTPPASSVPAVPLAPGSQPVQAEKAAA